MQVWGHHDVARVMRSWVRNWTISLPGRAVGVFRSSLLCAMNSRNFSQKQTSWVFNDQPCECADVGHSRKIGRAAKMGWEKIWLPAMIAASKPVKSTIGRFYCLTRRTRPGLQLWRHGSDFIYTKNSARPGSGFYLHKE